MPDTTGNDDLGQVQDSAADADRFKYKLPGMQVEPTSAFWLDDKTHIRVPALKDVQIFSENKSPPPYDRLALDFKADYPFDPATPNSNSLDQQLEILIALADKRGNSPYPSEVETVKGTKYSLTSLSRFLDLQPVPFGTILDTFERPQFPIKNVLEQHLQIAGASKIVNEGRELARVFENETPGLFHRQALNWVLFNRGDVSPPRQARIWMALDVTIYTALCAAWHYKWLRTPYSRLLRPKEYDRQNRLVVLFDHVVKPNGQELGQARKCPAPTAGTPRHPSWPSGHSTFSAAASHILEYFFSPDTLLSGITDDQLFLKYPPGSDDVANPEWIAAELRRLANNIGQARLWAGVHWMSDHIAGQKIGRSAAQAVIEQLKLDCTPPTKLPDPNNCDTSSLPDTNEKIEAVAGRGGQCIDKHDKIDQPKERGESFRRDFGVF